MVMHAYPCDYVNIAQRIMGDMLDYAVNKYDVEIDEFFGMFIVSDISKQFQSGNPTYVAGKTGCELFKEVIAESGLKLDDKEDVMYIDKTAEYWTGWALAYYQWYTGRTFAKIWNAVKLKDIVLPKGLNKIGDNSFADCYSLANIYYTGTKGDWEKTVIGKGNRELKTDKLITEYDRSIKVRGRISSCAYEGGKINVTADLDYTSHNCKAVLAVYYGRRLIAAEYKDLNEGAKSVSFSVDSSENTGLTAKVLFWESDLITPIAKPISAEVK